jgi:hypothetical protein
MKILRLFGLDKIYSEDVLPNREEAFRYLKSITL